MRRRKQIEKELKELGWQLFSQWTACQYDDFGSLLLQIQIGNWKGPETAIEEVLKAVKWLEAGRKYEGEESVHVPSTST
jgi:hypothetical protein